jgi:hypothetical protein
VCHLVLDNFVGFFKYIIRSVYVEMKQMKIMCLNTKPLIDVKRSGCIHDTVCELHLWIHL